MPHINEINVNGQRYTLSDDSSLPASFSTSLTAFMTDFKALLNELTYTTENHHASSVSADADAVIAALGSGDTPVTTHSTDAND